MPTSVVGNLPTHADLTRVAEEVRRLVSWAGFSEAVRTRVLLRLGAKNRVLSDDPVAPTSYLTLAAFQSAGGLSDPARAIPAAASMEFLMACGDLLDDVQDDEGPAIFDSASAAPVTEDVCVLLLLSHLSLQGLPARGVDDRTVVQVYRLLDESSVRALRGQQVDADLESRDDVTLTQCLETTAAKSASLTQCAAQMGATLSGVAPDAVELYGKLGWHLGMAAQLANDIAGVWPWGATTSDVRRHKKTLPVVATLTSPREKDDDIAFVRRFFSSERSRRSGEMSLEEDVRWAVWRSGGVRLAWMAASLQRLAAADTIKELSASVPSAAALERLIA